MSQVQVLPKINISPFKNKTAGFISRSTNFEHAQLNDQLVNTATAIDKAKTPEERKFILDHQLNVTIEAYSDLMSTLSRYACFVTLSYKVEKLWKLDLIGMSNPFRNDEEAFDYWVNEFLIKNGAKPSLRSKVKHYVRENDDLKMLQHLTFNKSWIVSKFKRILRGYGVELEGEFYNWAARKDTEPVDITTELVNRVIEQDWMVNLEGLTLKHTEKHGEEPDEKLVSGWMIEHNVIMEKRFARHALRKPEALGTRSARKIRSELEGFTNGDMTAVSKFIRTVHDKVSRGEDASEKFYEFLHSGFYDKCILSDVPFNEYNHLEVHHVVSRSEQTDKKLFNLIPICRDVHSEWNNRGGKYVLQKYGITEDLLLSYTIMVSIQYVQWLEKNSKRA